LTEPRITVLLPLRHYHPGFLAQALESAFTQTLPHWRLLVVYDGDEAELQKTLGAALTDKRVRLVRNDGRRLAGAINTGMRQATTDFVAILLGDDMWAPNAVEVLTTYIERHPDVDFFHSGRRAVDGEGRPISGELPPRDSFTLDEFVEASPVKHLLCWRREKGLAIGGLDETIQNVGPDDYDFPWSMAERGARFMAVPEILYVYRDHRESFRLTTHLPLSTHTRELRRILRKHGVGWLRAERRIARAKRGYLRQCLYRTPLDRWLKQRLGHEPDRGWRQRYR
jgi:glycosyltransferase involved in cell wall biosynthesis